jgi:hypothetical protein
MKAHFMPSPSMRRMGNSWACFTAAIHPWENVTQTFTDYFYRREPACENIQENLCCHQDPPHLW